GTVRDTYSALLAGVVVSGSGASFTTGADGTYTLTYKQGAAVTITAVKADYIVTGPSGGSYSMTIGSVPLTGKDFTMVHTKTIKGVVKNAGGTGIYNAVVQVGGTSGAVAITDIAGKYEINSIPTASGTEVYADALGYADNTQTVNTSPAATTTMELDIILTAKTEAGVIKNGGFESVSAGKPTDWTNDGPANISSTGAVGEFVSGTNGAKITPDDGAYSYLTQKIPVIAGSVYNLYWKMKGDAIPTEGGAISPVMPTNPADSWMTYHLMHPGPGNAMPGDPNCAFYLNGVYHLHYIYDKNGVNFAHVTSKDMVHWTWQPTTLKQEIIGHGMFSGTGYFTKNGTPGIIYHGWGTGRNQIALALDDKLETWGTAYPLIPVIQPGQDGSLISNWDPDLWLEGSTYYALSGGSPGSGQPPTLFKSTNLTNWTYLERFLTNDMPGVGADEDISCPNFFKIGNKRMLLCISHNMGCRYYLGEWNNEKFTPDFHARMTWNGNTFFAPESVLAKDGRRVMWAWLLYMPIAPTGVQSLPRELELPADGVLRIRPLKELEGLRYDRKQQAAVTVTSNTTQILNGISGNTLEMEVVFKPTTATEYGVDVLCDSSGANGLRVSYTAATKILRVGSVYAPFDLKSGQDLTLRIFIDKNLVEVFANDLQAALSAASTHVPTRLTIRLFSTGGSVVVNSVKAWKMKSIYGPSGATGIFQRVTFIDSTETNPVLAIKSEIYTDWSSSAPTEWTQLLPNLGTQKTRFTIPAGADTMQVQLGVTDFFSSGKSLYFDDVVVDRVGPTPAVTITASAGAGGSISPNGAVSVNYGANQTFTITPNAGWTISDVKVDNVSQGAIASYTFSSVTVNHTISATFVKPVGMNNKSALTDKHLTGKVIKIWGKVKSIGTGTFQISDGYCVNITIAGSTTGLDLTKTVVVTGTVNADKSVTAQTIQIL
ncbi:MAG: GH32 C-terminal domain-containing protein, partial [Armatimonadetes bacterium]|nr:GH32 C-terminal domain-containing protein [Armatimonadota bacterium]